MDRYPYRPPITVNPLLCGPPRIAGARTQRVIYTAEEVTEPTGLVPSQGQRIEWLVNGVVTSLRATTNVLIPPLYWSLGLDIIKEGTQHLCSDGFEPQRLFLTDLQPLSGFPDIPCWIPVRRGEEWHVNAINQDEETNIPWQLKLTLDEFLESPKQELRTPNETQFYRVHQTIPQSEDGPAMEIDFQRDGVVTGWRANVNQALQPELYDIGFDILRNGKEHMVTNGRSSSRVRASGASSWQGSEVFQACWFPVNKHEKWQVFGHNYNENEPIEWSMMFRVEEFTDRTANMFGPNAYYRGTQRTQG